ECRDSEEHPATVPVILALDVTGSMGGAAVETAKRLNTVMTSLYDSTKDVEFMIMGIGDLAYDRAPIQASQFESDIRIAEQLDKIYFEAGGGGNAFESYTAAWYFALYNTSLDCHSRGRKGLVITMGDEPLNPYLPKKPLNKVLGSGEQSDVETGALYKAAAEKFDLYHLAVIDCMSCGGRYKDRIFDTFGEYLDKKHLRQVNLDSIAGTVIDIVTEFAASNEAAVQAVRNVRSVQNETDGENLIRW
ncbi:MAG: VWA domain-containing protein, partial [Ruminococcus sp.]|nr:VWA domain-containing protein [Ruminococcus sp.]